MNSLTDKEKSEKAQITSIRNKRGTEGQVTHANRRYMNSFKPMDMTTLDKMDKFFASTNYKRSLKKLSL